MNSDLFQYYEQECNEDGRLQIDRAHQLEYLSTIRYFEKVFPKNAKVLDGCAGTGVYAFHLAQSGFRVTAGDLVPANVFIMEKKQAQTPLLEKIYTGDLLDLSRFETGSFDIVLCMGALYHLLEQSQREQAICECLRVLKKGGIMVAAYVNRYAAILRNCAENLANMDELLEYYPTGVKNLFYGSTPNEMKQLMNKFGLETLHHIATDGIGYMIANKINQAAESDFNKWLEYHFATCEDESLLGYSLHGLFIGRKIV